MPTLIFVAVAVALGVGPDEGPEALPPLNRKVFEFARANLGKPVGDGVCVTLAVDALREAGAARASFRDPKGDYTWGEPVADFKDVLPGDILQFRDAVFHGKRSLAGGGTLSWHQEYLHHTAIVAKVERGGKLITVYHQNVAVKGKPESDKLNVKEAELRMDSLKKGGWIRAYRPTPSDRTPPRKPFDLEEEDPRATPGLPPSPSAKGKQKLGLGEQARSGIRATGGNSGPSTGTDPRS